jgi:PAP_fibrillin
VLDSIKDVAGRGKDGLSPAQQQELDEAVAQLEQPGQGVQSPTTRPDLLDGRWKLLYTSSPGTNSPVQRAFTGTEAFTIFQEVMLGEESECRVNNVVEFGEDARCGLLICQGLAPWCFNCSQPQLHHVYTCCGLSTRRSS